LLEKAFRPTFDEDDLTKLPNYKAVTKVQIQGVPSAPFSMSFVPPMGQTNAQLRDALKRLSAAKYGKPRTVVEKEIFTRLGAADAEKKAKTEALKKAQQQRMAGMNTTNPSSGGGSSFLDEWLAKRQQMDSGSLSAQPSPMSPQSRPLQSASMTQTPPPITQSVSPTFPGGGNDATPRAAETPSSAPETQDAMSAGDAPTPSSDSLHLRRDDSADKHEVSFKIR
jgi:hypothetical protein